MLTRTISRSDPSERTREALWHVVGITRAGMIRLHGCAPYGGSLTLSPCDVVAVPPLALDPPAPRTCVAPDAPA